MPDEKARATGQSPKPSLKADQEGGRIVVDSETTLSGIPPGAWRYLLSRVTTVSIETMRIVESIRSGPR